MTKAELIDAVAQKADISKADAERTVDAFFEVVVDNAKEFYSRHFEDTCLQLGI